MRAKISRETEVTIKAALQGSEQETRVKAVNNAASYYANKSEEFAEISKQYSEDSEDYSNLAKDWANKLDETVDGLEYSSKYYAQKAKEAFQDTSEQVKRIEDTTQEGIDLINETKNQGLVDIETSKDGATLDVRNAEATALNNINETKVSAIDNINNAADSRIEQIDSKSDSFLNKNQITNCLTEIPQRIKLELNDGVLTLKAGSEIIIPNGFEEDGVTKKFIHEQLENDISRVATFNTQHYVFPAPEINNFDHYVNGNIFVQDTQPITIYKDNCWYDTSANRFKITKDTGATWNEVDYGLPIAITTSSTTGYTSIDQEFNGFGFLKNLVWVDKGVKGLIPNGRNEDGSLKNIEYTTQNVQVFNSTATAPYYVAVSNEYNLQVQQIKNYYFVDDITQLPSVSTASSKCYVESENMWYASNSGTGYIWEKFGQFIIFKCEFSSGTVTSFTPKTTFKAIDYNDKQTVTNWAFPSNTYTDLNVGATGSSYIAPANGYFYMYSGTTKGSYFYLRNQIGIQARYVNADASNIRTGAILLPVTKGTSATLEYNGTLSGTIFRFIYAEGEVK